MKIQYKTFSKSNLKKDSKRLKLINILSYIVAREQIELFPLSDFESTLIRTYERSDFYFKNIVKNNGELHIALGGTKLVGWCVVVYAPECKYIEHLRVLDEYQNKHVGTTLLNKVKKKSNVAIECKSEQIKFYHQRDLKHKFISKNASAGYTGLSTVKNLNLTVNRIALSNEDLAGGIECGVESIHKYCNLVNAEVPDREQIVEIVKLVTGSIKSGKSIL